MRPSVQLSKTRTRRLARASSSPSTSLSLSLSAIRNQASSAAFTVSSLYLPEKAPLVARRRQSLRTAAIPVAPVAPVAPTLATRPFTTTTVPRFDASPSYSLPKKTSSAKMSDIMALFTPNLLREVRDFWFEHLESDDAHIVANPSAFKRWFFGGEELDRACVERFAPTLEALQSSGVKTGYDIVAAIKPTLDEDPRNWLSLVLLLDQISRNCYRGKSANVVFKFFDPLARDVAHAAIERGIPDVEPIIRWRLSYRTWFYMPLMHSEDMASHVAATKGYNKVLDDVTLLENFDQTATSDGTQTNDHIRRAASIVQRDVEAAKKAAQSSVDFEKKHYDIIERFGRYPHRNATLGRQPTEEEEAYLANGGETFSG